MRIRKRLQSLAAGPDLSSSHPPQPMVAAAVAVAAGSATGAAAGAKQGEVVAVAGGGGEKLLLGLGSGINTGGGGGAASNGGGGRGLHLDGDLSAQTFHGCTTEPTSRPPQPDAAARWGEERRDPSPPGSRFVSGDVPSDHGAARDGGEVPKRELQEGENGDGDGDARRRRNMVAFTAATVAAAPKSLGAEAPEPPRGHGGHKGLATVEAEGVGLWVGDVDGARGSFPLRRRRGCCRARGARSACDDDDDDEEGGEEKTVTAERGVERPPAASSTRRRRSSVAAASSYTAAAAITAGSAATAARTASFNGSVGGPKSDYAAAVKKESGDVVVSTATATAPPLVDASRGGGKGKKRRSPAVLMEGSRCSRVNGRGWRCCQQTLVGYSLCEHHLGKGRLRSVSSVRCNGRLPARKKEEDVVNGAAAAPPQLPSPLQQQQSSGDVREYYEEEVDEEAGKRGRMRKIGMVKARSISSLLHLPNYSTTPTAVLSAAEPACPSPSPVLPDATGAATACAALHHSMVQQR